MHLPSKLLDARSVCSTRVTVLLLDRAGWHTSGHLIVPKNLTLIFLLSRAPELNPVENVWQYLRQTWLSNRVFEIYEPILDAACEAWRKLLAQPHTITLSGTRHWAQHRSIVRAGPVEEPLAASGVLILDALLCGRHELHC
jgi:transposase